MICGREAENAGAHNCNVLWIIRGHYVYWDAVALEGRCNYQRHDNDSTLSFIRSVIWICLNALSDGTLYDVH